jgi:hypothetical protein
MLAVFAPAHDRGIEMTRIFLLGLAIWLLPSASFAQSSTACLASARLQRDQCMRQTAGDNMADRHCMSRYISEMTRCRQTEQRQIYKPPSPPKINTPPIRQ